MLAPPSQNAKSERKPPDVVGAAALNDAIAGTGTNATLNDHVGLAAAAVVWIRYATPTP